MFETMSSRFAVPNKQVAVEPFPAAPKAEVQGGVLRPMNQAAVTPLRIVFPSEGFQVGHIVYVRSKLPHTTTYAKEIFEVSGKQFILLPETDVLLVERPESSDATSTNRWAGYK